MHAKKFDVPSGEDVLLRQLDDRDVDVAADQRSQQQQ